VIYVDADACPVKAEVEQVATRHKVSVKLVCNGGIRPSANPLVELVVVDAGPDVADMWIAERAGPGDVVITTDIPLAAKAVEAGAQVLKPNGEPREAGKDLQNLIARGFSMRWTRPCGAERFGFRQAFRVIGRVVFGSDL